MENYQLEKSTTCTAATNDVEPILDISDCDIEKPKKQPTRNSLVLVYSIVVMCMSAYFCKKHTKHWERWTSVFGTSFYLIMRAMHMQSA
jgi:PHP family Zn ribbon phosphoesterase